MVDTCLASLLPYIPKPTIGRSYCTALMCRQFEVGGSIWLVGDGTEVRSTVNVSGTVMIGN